MSIFSAIGKVAGTIGKGAVNMVTSTVGIGQVFDMTGGGSSPAAPAPVAAAAVQSVQQPTGTIGGAVAGLINGLTGFLTGQSHAQVDLHTQVGGTADPNASNSQLPSWLLPAGIGIAAIVLLSGRNKK